MPCFIFVEFPFPQEKSAAKRHIAAAVLIIAFFFIIRCNFSAFSTFFQLRAMCCQEGAFCVIIEVMAKDNRKFQNILLALGLILFLTGVVLAFLPPAVQMETYHFAINCALVLITAALVYVSILSQNAVVFYISANLCLISLGLLFLNARLGVVQLRQYWPIVIVIFGITLLPVGRFHYKKFKTFYVIPSAALTILGAFFFLFTFKIINMKMRVFFSYFMPFILIAGGISLIILYYVRQGAKDKFPTIQEEDDEPSLFSEDD